MTRKWIDFEGSPNRAGQNKARVSLNNRGVLLLNQRAYRSLGTPGAVTLHYDESERVIGLRPVDPRKRCSFPVKQKDKERYRVIYISPFCSHFNIRLDRTVIFNDVAIDNDGVMTLPLDTATAILRSR